MADIERYLYDKGVETIDERVEYLQGINTDNIDPQLVKLGLKTASDRDLMIRCQKEFKETLKNNPMAASLEHLKTTVDHINLISTLPPIDLPKVSQLESIQKAAWERHRQLVDLQKTEYDVLAEIAKSNQNLLQEQRRATKITWAVLAAGIIATFSVPISAISLNYSLIYNPMVLFIIAALAISWAIVIRYLMGKPRARLR
jgi:hypothetical protein